MPKTNNPSREIKVYHFVRETDKYVDVDKWDNFILLSDFETYKAEKEKRIKELIGQVNKKTYRKDFEYYIHIDEVNKQLTEKEKEIKELKKKCQ